MTCERTMLYQNVLNILTFELAIRFKENKKCKIAIFNFFLLSLYNQLLSICFYPIHYYSVWVPLLNNETDVAKLNLFISK
jgi:hypothetical protein